MSGGAFDYVSVKDLEDTNSEDRDNIIAALESYPFQGAKEAAATLRETIAKLRAAIEEASKVWEEHRPLLKAVEWDHSGDWSQDEVAKALMGLRRES